MVRKVTAAKFEVWAQDPANVEDVIRRVLEGGKVEKICLLPEIKQPYTLLWPLLNSPAWKEKFDAARKGYADRLVEKALEAVENVEAKKDEVAKAKLQSETYLGVAAKWDRDRYGDKQEVSVDVSHFVMRLPSQAPDTATWLKTINAVPAPALEAPKEGEGTTVTVPAGERKAA